MGMTTETTTPDDALPSWIDDTAAIKWVAERACVNPERDWDVDDVGEAFRAGQTHAAGLLEALEDQIDGCSMIVRMLSGQESSVAHSLRAMLNAQIDAARAAIAAVKGA
jgi:hypothetical protein